jgi:rhodanese-related sulfurtransferase
VSAKRRGQAGRSGGSAGSRARSNKIDAAARPTDSQQPGRRAQIGLLIVFLILISVVVIGADYIFGAMTGGGSGASPTGGSTATSVVPGTSQFGVVIQGNGGHWTNVTPDQLAAMLEHKDFTLLNVKTPYSGEIDGTDLYIPYDQLKARASELPPDKTAKIVVYCLSGHSSEVAAQTLLDLGYTNVWNLDGGMNAWTASGRTLVNKNR